MDKVTPEIKKEFENRMFHARSILNYVVETADEQEEKWIYRKKRTGIVTDENDKNAVAYRRFWAAMSTPKVDFYNTIVTAEAVREAFPDWINAGNSRLMHNSQPAGRVFPEDYEVLPDSIRIGISIPRHKSDILNDVDASLLRGVSLGFWPDWDMATYDRKTGVITFNRIRIAEVSIVDSGATPGTEIIEERSGWFDKAMLFVQNRFRNDEHSSTEDLEMDELKELQNTIESMVNVIGELRTSVSDIKTRLETPATLPEDTPPEPDQQRLAELEKTVKELRSMLTTEEALSPENIQQINDFVEQRDKQKKNERDQAPLAFAFGCIRSKITGRPILDGNDLVG